MLLDIFNLLDNSLSVLKTIVTVGFFVGLVVGIIIIILLNKLYLTKIPKKVKKKFGIFLGIFLIFGGCASGIVIGFKTGINNAIASSIYGTEDIILEKVKTSTGIDCRASLDEIFGISEFELEIENEIRNFGSELESEIKNNYSNVYETICEIQNIIKPFYTILDYAIKEYGGIVKEFINYDELENDEKIGPIIHFGEMIYYTAQISFSDKSSETQIVDFIERLVDVKDDIDFIKNYSFSDTIDSYVEKCVSLIQQYVDISIVNPIVNTILLIVLVFLLLCFLPILIRHILYIKKQRKTQEKEQLVLEESPVYQLDGINENEIGQITEKEENREQKNSMVVQEVLQNDNLVENDSKPVINENNIQESEGSYNQKNTEIKLNNEIYKEQIKSEKIKEVNSQKMKIIGIISVIFKIVIGILLYNYLYESFFIIWACLSTVSAIVPALIAKKKKRNFWAWYVYGIWLWLIAFIHSLFIRKK